MELDQGLFVRLEELIVEEHHDDECCAVNEEDNLHASLGEFDEFINGFTIIMNLSFNFIITVERFHILIPKYSL